MNRDNLRRNVLHQIAKTRLTEQAKVSVLEAMDKVISYAAALNMEYTKPWDVGLFIDEKTNTLRDTPFRANYGFEMEITIGNPNKGAVPLKNYFDKVRLNSLSTKSAFTRYCKQEMKAVDLEDFIYDLWAQMTNLGWFMEDGPSISGMKDVKSFGGSMLRVDMSDNTVWFFKPKFVIRFYTEIGDLMASLAVSFNRRSKNLRIYKWINDIGNLIQISDEPQADVNWQTLTKLTLTYEVFDVPLDDSRFEYVLPQSWIIGESKQK